MLGAGFQITPGVFAPGNEPGLHLLPVRVPHALVTHDDCRVLDTLFQEPTRALMLKARPWSEAAKAVADREVGRPHGRSVEHALQTIRCPKVYAAAIDPRPGIHSALPGTLHAVEDAQA